MPLTLNVDGKMTSEPDPTDIAHAFESLDKRSGGLITGPGLSMIILEQDEAHLLMATGTYASGFLLSYHDGERECEYNSDMKQPVPVGEVVGIFQAYARGADWGRSKFKWERNVVEDKPANIIKRLLIIGILGFLAYVIIKHLAK